MCHFWAVPEDELPETLLIPIYCQGSCGVGELQVRPMGEGGSTYLHEWLNDSSPVGLGSQRHHGVGETLAHSGEM